MSINGLYDSVAGDRLARKSMACFKKPEPDKNDRFCECGRLLHINPKWRDGKPVCDGCAEIISRRKKENPTRVYQGKHVCVTCGQVFPMRLIVVRNKQEYCKDHAPDIRVKFAHTYKCSKCGEFKPNRELIKRSGVLYCKKCAVDAPKGRLQPCTTKCSVCGTFVTRKKLFMRQGKLFCQKCLDDK